MDYHLNRSRGKWYVTALVAAQFLLLAYQVQRPNARGIEVMRDGSVQAILPAERLTQSVVSSVGDFFHRYAGLRATERENQSLQARVTSLELQNQRLKEAARELPQLEALLGFQRSYGVNTLAAQVVGRGISSDAQVVYVNRGAGAGLRRNMAVITTGGVVGKVSQVLAASAQVLLVTDPDSGVGALIIPPAPVASVAPPAPVSGNATGSSAPASTTPAPTASAAKPQAAAAPSTPPTAAGGVHGILQGLGAGRVELRQVLKDEPTPDGAQVITSGEDQIYPKGIPIGTVIGSQPSSDGIFKTVQVKLAANLGRLEQVLIITGQLPPPPDEADGGLTAADIRQARLPALPTPGTGNANGAKVPAPAAAAAPADTPPAEGDDLNH